MKRLLIILGFALILLSCAPKGDILDYQNGSVIAECIINDKYSANIIKKEDFRALELTDGALSGISFVRDNGAWSARIDEIEIPIDESDLNGIVALTSIFDLSESAITTAEVDGGAGVICFDMNGTSYTVTYNEQSLPEHITINGDGFSLELKIISIKKADIV